MGLLDSRTGRMKVTVVTRSGKQLAVLDTLNPNSTIKEVQKELSLSKANVSVARQRLTLPSNDDKARPVALDADKKLSDYGLTTDCKIVFKDLGPQISWRMVFVLEYLGPMLLYPIFYLQPWWIYGSDLPAMDMVQHLAFACFMLHYLKREYETLFVHRFGNGTMPLRNLFKNSSYYWGNAVICSYFINRPGYTAPPFYLVLIGLVIFMIGETGNFHAHQILRHLRRPGTRERNIPRGGLFEWVSCANYTYEILGWLGFCVMTSSLAAVLFTAQGAFQMYAWAIGKHKRYKREFNGENGTTVYPKNRKALIPFLV